MKHGLNTEWGGRAPARLSAGGFSRDPNFTWVAANSERWGLARTLALPLERPPCFISGQSLAARSESFSLGGQGRPLPPPPTPMHGPRPVLLRPPPPPPPPH